jgi:hypothetical protein
MKTEGRRMERPRARIGTNALTQPGSWAAAAPLLCAAHCIALPVLVLVSPAFHLNPAIEYAVMAGAGMLAVLFLGWGVAAHGNRLVWLPAMVGLAVWIGAEATLGHSHAGLWLHAVGSALLAGGLIWNAWLRHNAECGDCGCPAHENARPEGRTA